MAESAWNPPPQVTQILEQQRLQARTNAVRAFRHRQSDAAVSFAQQGLANSGALDSEIAQTARDLLADFSVGTGRDALSLLEQVDQLSLPAAREWLLADTRAAAEALQRSLAVELGRRLSPALEEDFRQAIGSALSQVALELDRKRLSHQSGVPSPVPREINERDEFKIKRWEELLALVKLGYEQAIRRWDTVEEKTTKYATLLGVIVAAAAVSFSDVAQLVQRPHNWLTVLFLAAYLCLALTAVAAFVCFLRALKQQTIDEPPLGRTLLEHVAANNYVDVLYSMSVSFVVTTEQVNGIVATKARDALWGYRFLRVALVFAILSTVAYLAVKTREEMTRPSTVPVSPAPAATPSDTSPNPAVTAPPAQSFQRGIESGPGAQRPSSAPAEHRED